MEPKRVLYARTNQRLSVVQEIMGQHQIPWWKTDLGDAEVRGIEEAIRDRRMNQGPGCKELERRLAERLEVPYVVLTTSGSAALLLSLMACDVRPGDEVVVPAATFIATAHAALLLGASVRLVDVRPDRPLIDVEKIEAAITERTKVILPVHLNGAACEIPAINEVASRYGLKVVEDAAQAFCSRNRHGHLGTQADMGAFSLGVTKLVTTGEGGFVAVRDEEIYTKLLKLRNQGTLALADNVFDAFGFNLRFNDMLAAIGLAQLNQLPRKIAAAQRVYQFYEEQLADLDYLQILEVRTEEGELPLWSEVLCAERDKVVALLKQRDILVKPFHPCLSDSKHLQAHGRFPVAQRFAAQGMTLPSRFDQVDEDLERTVRALREIAADVQTKVDLGASPMPDPFGEQA